jgi:hypothetical protein
VDPLKTNDVRTKCGWNCGSNPEMPLADSQIRALKATDKRQKPSRGDSLFLLVEPISKGGGKSLVGRMRPCALLQGLI